MSTAVAATLTREAAATVILNRAEPVYGNYGLTAALPRLIDLLTARVNDIDVARVNADKFRNVLWGLRAGGNLSVATARLIYSDLGRLNETESLWVIGGSK